MKYFKEKKYKIVLTKEDTWILKGVAIIFIVLHNFYHKLPDAIIENEFEFHVESMPNFLAHLFPFHISVFLMDVLSFYGHYGVYVFFFLSGYGLCLKYDKVKLILKDIFSLFLQRILKLWKLFIPLLVLFLMLSVIKSFYSLTFWNACVHILNRFTDVVLFGTFISNLIPGKEFLFCGPWWFFSVIVQLYIWYFFLFRKLSVKELIIVCFAAFLLQVGIILWGSPEILFWIRYNSFGWLPVFIVGIISARKKEVGLPLYVFYVMGIALLFSNLNVYSWLFFSVFFPIVFFFICQPVIFCQGRIRSLFLYIGQLSAYIFVINGLVRDTGFYILPVCLKLGVMGKMLSGIIFLIISILCAQCYKIFLSKGMFYNKSLK